MPTITPTVKEVPGMSGLDGYQITWASMANGDVGGAIGPPILSPSGNTVAAFSASIGGFADRSVQVEGTFGSGGSVAVQGCNDGNTSHFRALNDPFGNTIAITAAGIKGINESTIWTRPAVTAGDGSTSVTVTMFVRKTQSP